jgi:hypothetical protein
MILSEINGYTFLVGNQNQIDCIRVLGTVNDFIDTSF